MVQLTTHQMQQAMTQFNALANKAERKGNTYLLYRDAISAIFDAYGYDPRTVREWGVNELGFETYNLDEDGKRMPHLGNGSFAKVWHEWPSEEMKTEVMNILNIQHNS